MNHTKTKIGKNKYEYRSHIVQKGTLYWTFKHNGEEYTQRTLGAALATIDRAVEIW
jgi:hypothetical protein